jgi:hypothetical protein
VGLVHLGKGCLECPTAKASGARTLFVIQPRQLRFQSGLQWMGEGQGTHLCSVALAFVIWESPKAKELFPWDGSAGWLLREWARTALADGEKGLTLVGGAFGVSGEAPVRFLLGWHGCPLSRMVVRWSGPDQVGAHEVIERESSTVAILRQWPREKWVYGIFPEELPAACSMLHGSARVALRGPFLGAWWRIWQRVDRKVRPVDTRDRDGAADAKNTKCQRILDTLDLEAAQVWPGRRPDRWTGSAELGDLDLV